MYIAVNALAREGYTVIAATQKLGVTRDDYYNAKRKIAPSADTERGDGHLNGDESATAKDSTPDAGGTGNNNGDRE